MRNNKSTICDINSTGLNPNLKGHRHKTYQRENVIKMIAIHKDVHTYPYLSLLNLSTWDHTGHLKIQETENKIEGMLHEL